MRNKCRFLDLANVYTIHSKNYQFVKLSPNGKYLAILIYELETLFIQLYEMKDNNYNFLDEANLIKNVSKLSECSIYFSLDSSYLIIQLSINDEDEEQNFLLILQTQCLQKFIQTTFFGLVETIRLNNEFLIYVMDDQKDTNYEYVILNLQNGEHQPISLQNQQIFLNSLGWCSDKFYYLDLSIQKSKLRIIKINYWKNNKTILNKIQNKFDSIYSGRNKIAIYNSGQYKIFMTNQLKKIRSIYLTEDYSQNIIVDQEIYLYEGQIEEPEVKIVHGLNYKEFTLKNSSDIYGNIQQFVKPALFLQVSEPKKIRIFQYK